MFMPGLVRIWNGPLPYDRVMRIPVPPETRSEDLPPMRVNTVTMVLVGIGVWLVALVVVLVLQATGSDLGRMVLICLAGIGFGVLGLAWAVPQHRRSQRREAERASEAAAAADDHQSPTTPPGVPTDQEASR